MSLKEEKFSTCLYYSVNSLSRILTRMAEEAFTSVNLAPTYAFLLMTVNEKPGIQPGEISRELQLDPSTVTRLVEKMEHRGFLERRSEGRATHVEPTQKSLDLNEKIHIAWNTLLMEYKEILGERYSEVLTEMTFTAVQELDK